MSDSSKDSYQAGNRRTMDTVADSRFVIDEQRLVAFFSVATCCSHPGVLAGANGICALSALVEPIKRNGRGHEYGRPGVIQRLNRDVANAAKTCACAAGHSFSRGKHGP
jgi:hypothetical protein